MSWDARLLENGERHVVPLDDLRTHAASRDCWCSPTDDEGVFVHHSLDKRETYEQGRKPT